MFLAIEWRMAVEEVGGDAVLALAGVVLGATVGAIDGTGDGLDVLLAGLVVEVLDAPFYVR